MSSTFTRQFSQSLVTKILMIVLRLAKNAILARVLGPMDRGIFSLVSSLPELIMTVGNCGIINAAAYQAANETVSTKKLFANINLALLLLAVLLLAIALFWVHQEWLVKDDVQTLLAYQWPIALATVLVLYKTVNINLLNVLNRITSVNLFSLFESLLPLLLFLGFWWLAGVTPLLAAVYAWLLGLAILAVFSSLGRGNCWRIRFDPPVQRQLFSYGSRSYFDSLFLKLLLRVDFLFVSAMVGAKGLGYYAMASAAAELLLVVPNSLAIPLYSSLLKNGGQSKDQTVAMVLRMLLATMTVLALLVFLLGKPLILVLFGKEYLPAYIPMSLLLPGLVALSVAGPARLALLGENRPGAVSVIGGLSLLVDIVFNLLLIPLWGINGSAIAATASYLCGAICTAILFIHQFHLQPSDIFLLRRTDLDIVVKTFNKILHR